ncbi:L-fucono-1,5-lactonase-like [Oratosquilla oratoria]|uniref:L-fucono-1,5-lactonase-like n=1 Tax=Oratosquilla oratoria TaxID=337810 RepID=UPI003F774987
MEGLGDCVDTHCHLWNLKRFKYDWPTPDMAIYKDFNAEDLKRQIEKGPVKEVIYVQCLNNSPEETRWVAGLAKEFPFIKGIIAGLDPSSRKFEEELVALKKECPQLVGVRFILEFYVIPEAKKYLTSPEFIQGLRVLAKHDLTFDLLLRPPIMEAALVAAKAVPEVRMVVDHLAKPMIKEGLIDPWKNRLEAMARCPNLYCKLSGLVNEAERKFWRASDFIPYVEHAVSVFGPDRVMFGSDWPVCEEQGADHKRVLEILATILRPKLSDEEMHKVFSANAKKFYKI